MLHVPGQPGPMVFTDSKDQIFPANKLFKNKTSLIQIHQLFTPRVFEHPFQFTDITLAGTGIVIL
jgi:hypothetical protein